MTDVIGPVELIVLGFSGNAFNGDVIPALGDLVARGVVRIIDFAFVAVDTDGAVAILEMTELSAPVAEALLKLEGEVSGLLSENDLIDLAADLTPGTSIAVMMVEHLWATTFAQAVRASGGELLMAERIPGAVIDAARQSLIAASAAL